MYSGRDAKLNVHLHLAPRVKNEWSWTSTPPIQLLMLTGQMYRWTNHSAYCRDASTRTGQNIDSAEVCQGSTQPFQENALLVFQITSQPLPSARFSFHCSLIKPPFARLGVLTLVSTQLMFSGVIHGRPTSARSDNCQCTQPCVLEGLSLC